MSKKRVLPDIIKQVGFDFSWSEKKVWALDLPVKEMSIDELIWHFDIPFWDEKGGCYNLKPWDVVHHPDEHKEEYDRTLKADLSHPLDIMKNKGKWLLLDGLHRLVKAYLLGHKIIRVREVPRSMVPMISK